MRSTRPADPWWIYGLVLALAAPIFLGPLLAYLTGERSWLLGLLFLIFFV